MIEEQESRQKILDAAFIEFANKGFNGATIKSIAQAAELKSPSLIYWYFPTKEALFQAVIEARSPFLQIALDPGPILEQQPEVVLPILAQGYLNTLQNPDNQQMLRIFLSESTQRQEIAETVSQQLLTPVLGFLKTYLEHQVQLGCLRPHDVRASARAFVGMLIPFAMGAVIFPALQNDALTSTEHIQTVVEIYLQGLQTKAEG